MNKKIAIIGAGISGISSGKLLHEKGMSPVIFEKKDTIGGLIKCTLEEGNLFHRVGGHVFNSKNTSVLHWFWSHFEKEQDFALATRNAVIYLKDTFVKYPIEMHLNDLGTEYVEKIVKDLVDILQSGQSKQANNFKEFLLNNFGSTLCSLYFTPYNKKIWQTELENLSLDWLEGKLPMPDIEKIFSSNITGDKNDGMVHSSFYYPKNGGSQFIANQLSKGLQFAHGEVKSINIMETGEITVNDLNDTFEVLIYTGDIRSLNRLLTNDAIRQELPKNLAHLPSHGTSNVLCECDTNQYSWVYIPEEKFKSHRIIMTGNFSESNNAKGIGPERTTCTVEFTGKVAKETIDEELKELPFNLTPIAYNYEENSYIINTEESQEIVNQTRKVLKKYNIFLCGRFAEWQYYNMDVAIESAMRVTNEIIR